MEIKQQVLEFCWNHVNERIESLKKRSDALQESLTSETKSSAGDKHETGRAMVQLEQEKLGKQKVELEKTKMILSKVDIAKRSEKISLGSLVKTTTANYFIAISAGVLKKDSDAIFCISASSPIAKILLGKEKGDAFAFNGNENSILEVM